MNFFYTRVGRWAISTRSWRSGGGSGH